MNPIMLQLASTIISRIGNLTVDPKSTGTTGRHFYTRFLAPLQASDRGTAYLESLRKSLLVKGRPLEKITLGVQDFPVLEKFLIQCGFSPSEAKSLLRDLSMNNTRGEINLSWFFRKALEGGPSRGNTEDPVAMDPSMIPHLGSLLVDFGLGPHQLDRVFASAKRDDGGLDLPKFVTELKKIRNRQGSERSPGVSLDSKLVAALSKMGIDISDNGRGAPITLEDFIKCLEQMTGMGGRSDPPGGPISGAPLQNPDGLERKQAGSKGKGFLHHGREPGSLARLPGTMAEEKGKGSQLPAEVKEVIDQILNRVVVKDEPPHPVASFISNSKVRPSLILPQGETGKVIGHDGEEKRPPYLKGSNKAEAKIGQQPVDPVRPGRTFSPSPDPEGHLTTGKGPGGEGSGNGMERVEWEPSHQVIRSPVTDLTGGARQHQKPPTDPLPAYLLGQVGRQISRSLLAGKKTIQMQLKPPELGVLKVEMDIKDNVLKMGMTAEKGTVKELILSNVHELREALLEQGVKLGKIEVQIHQHFGHSEGDLKEGSKENQRWGRQKEEHSIGPEAQTEDLRTWLQARTKGDHLLDLTA